MKSTKVSVLGILAACSCFMMGCDEEVKATLTSGLQSGALTVAQTLVNVIFQILGP